MIGRTILMCCFVLQWLWITAGGVQAPTDSGARSICQPEDARPTEIADPPSSRETKGSLVFYGEHHHDSEPVPISSPDTIKEFFSSPQNRLCLVSAGHSVPARSLENVSPVVFDRLRAAAAQLKVREPDQDDILFSIQTVGFHVPGLTVRSTAIVNSKLVLPNKSGAGRGAPSIVYPRIESVAIEDSSEATGLRAFVWLFNQLTGVAKNKGGEEDQHGHRVEVASVGVVTVQPDPDGAQLRFHVEASVRVQIHFPSVLLRLLPVSKSTVERRGSKAIVKTMSTEVHSAVANFRDSYCAQVGSQ